MQAWGDKLELYAVVALFSLLGAIGCKPEIGDDCQVSTDCSNIGDRLCDTTQPGGYCTIFNCEPGTCPEEAICVAFKTDISSACPDPQGGIRLTRTFCLKSCDGNDDCRGGYDCVNMNNPDNPWGAQVVESGSVNGKVCIVPHPGASTGADASSVPPPAVCTGGGDAGFDVSYWEPDTGSTPVDAGADAADAGDAGDASADGSADGGADASSDASSD
jgi:hypothetical protein